jgi:hypothetical protein
MEGKWTSPLVHSVVTKDVYQSAGCVLWSCWRYCVVAECIFLYLSIICVYELLYGF